MIAAFHFYLTNTFNNDWKNCSFINGTAFIYKGSQTVANCMQFQGLLTSVLHPIVTSTQKKKKKKKKLKNGRRLVPLYS